MEVDELDYLLPANCPNPYFDSWDRHNSIAFSTATKGLRNAPGENNCFVNSAVQVFWHLDVFRRSYRRLSGHTCMGNSCIFCALKVIFTQFQFSDQSSLHPDALRKALAETFANQQRFQLGHMDDAAECFENILRRIHLHIANNCNEDTCNAPHCLPHQKFSLNIVEKVVCPCGASSNPLKFSEMVHYISAKALVSQARVMQETGDTLHPDRFGLLLRNANAMGDIRDCPGLCGKTVQIRRTLLNSPDVVSIGLVWDSDHPTVEMTTEVARNIGTTILMQDVFHSVMQDLRVLPKLQLVGLVCYYGKHYSTFVFHSKLQVWIYFDDATVREIGPRWEHVVDKCSKGRYQPLLLLYANPNASPVPVETAPKKRTMAPGYGIPGGPEEESSLDRTHESISSQHSYQRSRTPNPEPSHQLLDQAAHPRARSVTPSAYELSREESSTSFKSIDHSRQQSFVMAMSSSKSDNKAKHPLKFGGQASAGVGVPGPMVPSSDQRDSTSHMIHSSSSSYNDNENYSDYTLSTSDQYRRPSLGGFEPAKLPLTPNMKGYNETQRKESFKKGKETVRADVVRYQVDATTRPQDSDPFQGQTQGYPYPGQGYDPNKPPALPPKTGTASMFYQPQSQSHFRQRSISQGGDEAYGSDADTSSCDSHSQQHTIVKPMASSQNYDHLDGMSHSHTPVQSGLATLPRKKKESSKDLTSYPRQGSISGQDINNRQSSTGTVNSIQDQRATPTPTGLPPAVPVKYPSTGLPEKVESTSTSTSGKKIADGDKKAKKLKKEQKKAEKKKAKDNSRSQPDLTAIGKPPLHPSTSTSIHRPEEYRDEKVVYIDRRMVESVLKHQGLQRQPSTHSTNSASSIESDSIMGRLLASRHGDGSSITTDASFDNVSLGSHKDSGYGSSDRNSSSSTGSGTVDPYTQYFISKSMVVPRNLNPQFLQHPPQPMVSDFTNPQVYTASMGQPPSGQTKDLSGMSKEEMSRHLYEALTQRKVMHPIKESSQEDILKILPKEPIPAPVRDPSPASVSDGVGKEGRAPPIPPKNFAAFQVSKSSHQREPSIDSLDKDEVKNDYFLSMCEKADELMDSCIIAETQGDLTAALRCCDSALVCLKEAMNQTDISNKASVYAQKKHNSCLLKSRSLFKRTGHGSSDGSSQGGKRSSITSTDSDNSDKPMRRVSSREGLLAASRGSAKLGQQQQPQPQQIPSAQIHHQHQDSTSSAAAARKSPLPMSQTAMGAASRGRDYQSQGALSGGPPLSATQQFPPSSRSHMSRAASAEQTDSAPNHARSSSNSSVRSSASVPCSMSQPPVQSIAKSQTKSGNLSSSLAAGAPVPLDAYGTLPRNRKPRRTSDPTGNSEVYQMYLNRQKNLQGSSGSDSRESDSSSCDGNVQKKLNQAELRELRENSVVQRQMQQFGNTGQQLQSPRNDMSADPRQQMVETRSQLAQRNSYDGSGQRSSASSIGSIGGSSTVMSQAPPQPTAYSADRQSHYGQGPQNSNSQNFPSQQQQRSSSCQPTVSLTSVQSLSHSSSKSSLSQSDSGSVQPLPSQQQPPQQRPQSAQPMSQTSSVHHQQLHHSQAPYSSYTNQQQADQMLKYPSQGQLAQPVSGYSQPLPGHRPTTPVSQQGSRSYSHANDSNSNAAHAYVQGYPQQHNMHGQGMSPPQSQNFSHDSRSQSKFSSTDPSSQGSNYVPGSSHGPSNSPRTAQQQQQQQNSVQNLSQSVQNLGIKKRNSGGPPPAPPARTTSNPDFKQQLPVTSQQQNQRGYYQQQQHQQQPVPNPEVGSSSQQKSVARVQPNSHLDLQVGAAVGTNIQQRSLASEPLAHSYRPPSTTQFLGSDQVQGTQLKHAISSTGLNYISLAPRPLERYASQPDCKNLVDPASYSNKDFMPPSFAASSSMSSTTNDRPESVHRSGVNTSLQQTSESYSMSQANQNAAGHLETENTRESDYEQSEHKPSVRALASKFDKPAEKPAVKPKPNALGISRTRSKSESGSKKPKSVLKSKKNKSNKTPRKSVTFAEDLSNYAAGYESAAELTSFSKSSNMNERAYFSDDEDNFPARAYSDNELDDVEDSSNSDDTPFVREELACQLCRKREIEAGKSYCSKCSFYMSRLVQS